MPLSILTQVNSDGLTLAVEEFGVAEGEPVIYAHGLAYSRALSRLELAPLADRYRVVIFDQRGHADSTPVTDPRLYDPHRVAADIAAIMDTLGIDRAVVGGESMGAASSLVFALRWPERVKVLLQGTPALSDQPHPERQGIKDGGTAVLQQGMEACVAAWEPMLRESGMTPEGTALCCSILRTHHTESIGMAFQTVADWVILNDLNELRQLQMPVQVLAVEQDPVHPLELAQRMAAVLPNARLMVLPSSNAIWDDPSQVGHLYRDFLDGVFS